jgi:uncharacterized protein
VQGFKVPVDKIIDRPGEYRDIELQAELSGVSTALAVLQDDPIDAQLRAESVVEGILVTGKVHGLARFNCARCLKELEGDVDLEVCEMFVAPGHEAPPEEDSYKIDGLEMNLAPMLRDAVALALPLNPICKMDCAGLCAHCGKDLNEGPCGCKEEEMDPRWAALSELRDKLA